MAKIKSKILEDLFSELRFAPAAQQQNQLRAAGELALIIEPQKQYPFEFICFKLTGYRLKEDLSGKFISGADLTHDLQIIINKLSRKVAPRTADLGEEVFTVEQLAAQMNVSTKTIRRWRQKGLTGWIFVFDNEKKMLGFPASSIDEFAKKNPEITKTASKFSQLNDTEKQNIFDTARQIARTENLSRYQVILQTAAATHRSKETIRTLLIDFEQSSPKKKVFAKPAGAVSPHDAKTIHKLYAEDTPVADIMQRFHRSRSSIYRIVNQRRAKNLSRLKIEYIDSPQFAEPNAAKTIVTATEPLLAELAKLSNPLLNRIQETELFRRYNFLKYIACAHREQIVYTRPSGKLLNRAEANLNAAEHVKKLIIESNLGLVISIARKHLHGALNMPDLVSEGNMSLMRAVEKFDYSRGYRFSTYATLAIAKDYARKIPAETFRLDSPSSVDMESLSHDIRGDHLADITAIETAAQSLDEVIENNLTKRQQYIIRNHFGLEGNRIIKKAKTLEEIGRTLNLSRERVRQIELIALQQLRHNLSPEQFDLLTKK
ncbi:MAG: sigma-70 family RNA polymerase sigma factor [Planctomycetes bacterium]|nr:sigma-70 family RNA polymerase sigma factor [Planctomycetota bacterium]